MTMCLLDFAGYAFPVEGLGPGRRIAVWVRGCERHCPGCITPELWATGTPEPVDSIVEKLIPLLAQADGISISGGEPFYQAAALTALIDRLREHVNSEVLVYTGYLLEELQAGEEAWRAFLSRIDLLIDGPFVDTAANTLQWRGSDNQRVHLLSSRAQRYAEECEQPMPEPRPLQVQLLGQGQFRLIGIPRRGDMERYRAAMAACGLEIQVTHE